MWLYLISFILFANTEVPQDAVEALNQIPGKKVSLSLVMNKAIKNSDSFKQLRAQKKATELPTIYADAPYDWNTSLSYGINHDDTEPLVASAAPSNIESDVYNLEFNKYLSTGTALSFSFEHGSQMFDFAGSSFPKIYESVATFGLSQNLLKDSLGYASRKNWQSAREEKLARQKAYEKDFQKWTQNISQLFYTAWLTQAQVETARKSTELKKRLMQVSRKKLSRGTTEKPDFLQIESSYLNALSIQNSAEKDLQAAWQRLVILAKLPVHWINIDASIVPIALDDPSEKAEMVCKKGKTLDTYLVQELEHRLKAAEKKKKAAENSAYPDLKLNANYGMNGIDDKSDTSLEETQDLDHTRWYVGLSLSYPIGNSKARADLLSAKIEEQIAQAKKSDALSSLEADWISVCNAFYIAQENYKHAKNIYEKQSLRARLEEKRFRIGRSNVFQVVQAGDDSAQAGFNLNRAEVERRNRSWEVLALGDKVKNYIDSLGVSYE